MKGGLERKDMDRVGLVGKGLQQARSSQFPSSSVCLGLERTDDNFFQSFPESSVTNGSPEESEERERGRIGGGEKGGTWIFERWLAEGVPL